MKRIVLFVFLAVAAIAPAAGVFAEEAVMAQKSVFDQIAEQTVTKDGVKEITYEQFVKIRAAGEPYVLLDVLSEESYNNGHIESAGNFPVFKIDSERAGQMLSPDARVVVYCGSFQCTASTDAARKLTALGYNVLDYKGGLKEWQEKGHALIK